MHHTDRTVTRNTRWIYALILVGIVVFSGLSLYSVNLASAQKPGAPTFTVSVTNSINVIPTTITIDPYTGANVTNAGHTTASFTVTVTIQNSPQVTAYLLGIKGHYSTVWQYPCQEEYNITAFASSDSQTVITFSGNNASGAALNQIFLKYSGNDGWGINVPFGGKLDFQLQAVSGGAPMKVFFGYDVIGGVSGWSSSNGRCPRFRCYRNHIAKSNVFTIANINHATINSYSGQPKKCTASGSNILDTCRYHSSNHCCIFSAFWKA